MKMSSFNLPRIQTNVPRPSSPSSKSPEHGPKVVGSPPSSPVPVSWQARQSKKGDLEMDKISAQYDMMSLQRSGNFTQQDIMRMQALVKTQQEIDKKLAKLEGKHLEFDPSKQPTKFESTIPMVDDYKGEDVGGGTQYGKKVARMSEKERAFHLLQANGDNPLTRSDGVPLNTADGKGGGNDEGWWAFGMSNKGNFYGNDQTHYGKFQHSSFMEKPSDDPNSPTERVTAPGLVKTEDGGKNVTLRPDSGHYLPKKEHMELAAEELRQRGAKVNIDPSGFW